MTVHHIESGERRPGMNMTRADCHCSPAGAIVAIAFSHGLVGVPEARPLLLASGGFGILLGLILY